MALHDRIGECIVCGQVTNKYEESTGVFICSRLCEELWYGRDLLGELENSIVPPTTQKSSSSLAS